MTNEELKAAIEVIESDVPNLSDYEIVGVYFSDCDKYADRCRIVVEAARELSQLKEGTHPDMVLVPREQWRPIETYDYQNFPEVWLAAWIEPSEYAKENGASSRWDIGIGRCWHVNTRKFTGVLGGSPIYWCKTNKPDLPAQKGNA